MSDLIKIAGGGDYDCPEPEEPTVPVVPDSVVKILFDGSSLDEIIYSSDDVDEGVVNKYVTSGNVQDVGGVLGSTPNVSTYAWVIAEDDLGTSSNTQVPTQASVKAYVDSQVVVAAGVSSVNSVSAVVGDISLDTDDIPEGATNLYVTEANMSSEGGVTSGTLGTSGFKWVKDEDNMTSDSNVHVATQQSIKAYVDAQVVGGGGISSVNLVEPTDGNVTIDTDNVAEGSTNKYATQEQLDKLDDIAASAEVNVQVDWDQVDSGFDDYILNKPTALSEFTNDSGYLTAYAVSSVNGSTGDVVLDTDNVTEGTNKYISAAELLEIAANTAKVTYPSDDSTKLGLIEAQATADQSDAEIETAYNAQVAIPTDVQASDAGSNTVYRWSPSSIAKATPGAAIAYGTFNPHATTPTIDGNSLNFSGVRRISTGQYYFDLSDSITGDYSCAFGYRDAGGVAFIIGATEHNTDYVRCILKTSGNAVSDGMDSVTVTVFQHP